MFVVLELLLYRINTLHLTGWPFAMEPPLEMYEFLYPSLRKLPEMRMPIVFKCFFLFCWCPEERGSAIKGL